MRIRALVLALAAVALLATAACGDGGGDESTGRPTESALSIKLRNDGGFPPTSADCVAEVLVASDISDAGLRDFLGADLEAGGDLAQDEMSTKDQEALAEVAQDLNTCLGGQTAPASTAPAAESTAPTTAPGDTGTTAPTTAGPDTTTATTAPPGTTATTTTATTAGG
ncbi:MAG TPA: hypothetical protein VEW93_12895 [Acidimicrobiales bacterium]|nr:hypothetical protein [Acidimicrobiales bacterium]